MDIDIKELIKAASEGIDLSRFKGDVVGVKVVENEFGNIEPGGIGIQIINGRKTTPTQSNEANGETAIPEKLMTDEARMLMARLVEGGFLDDAWQPAGLSGSERSLLAKAVSERLEINDRWQVFGKLWGEKPQTLRGYLNKALEQKKSLEFQEKIAEILA